MKKKLLIADVILMVITFWRLACINYSYHIGLEALEDVGKFVIWLFILAIELLLLLVTGGVWLFQKRKGLKEIKMNYNIRALKKDERGILADFLYEAIFVPKGAEAPPRSIIEQPELQVYLSDFGKKDDYCLVAETDGGIVGAVWARIMEDYGHIDDKTPSLAIALYKEYRGKGIGTELMKRMLTLLRESGYEKASLSVQRANYAYQMYRKLGFAVISENGEELVMVKRLAKTVLH